MRSLLPASLALVLVFVLACNIPIAVPQADGASIQTQVAQQLTAAAQQAPGAPAGTAAPPPTSTQFAAPTAASTPVPCNLATFVADVTVPDDTVIGLNKSFTKTWRLKNVGSCSWTSGYQVVFDSGDQMGGPASQQLTNGKVDPGQTIDISIDLHAPAAAGTYKGNWKLRDPGGAVFGLNTGGPFWVQIKAQMALQAPPDWPLKKNGDSGPEVTALQHLLVAHGENLTVDGVFGPITKSKVQHFQGQNGLAADGIVGPKTWPKLILQVKQGSHGPAVRAVQQLLNDKFGHSLTVDGAFGAQTDAAVRDYQAAHGLTVDGIVGPITWQSMIGE
jgi:hypothetical protein